MHRPTTISIPGIIFIFLPLLASAQTPVSVTFPSASGGSTSCRQAPLGTVSLSEGARVGGLVIQLSSNTTSVLTVPPTITAAAGAKSVDFTATCTTSNQAMPVIITASANGVRATVSFTVLAPVLEGIAMKVDSAGALDGSAKLIGPAPPGGVIVTLSGSPSSVGTVPPSVTIPARAESAHFTVPNLTYSQATPFTVTGTGLGVTKAATVTLTPPTPTSVAILDGSGRPNATFTMTGGQRTRGIVTLVAPAGQSGVVVQLSSSSAAATVPPTVAVQPGQTQAPFEIRSTAVVQTTTVTLSASVGNVSKNCTLTLNTVSLSQIKATPDKLIGGQNSQGEVSVNAGTPAPAGGLTVQLSSSHSSVVVPPSVTIPAGAAKATFVIDTQSINQPQDVTLTGTVAGVSKTARLTVAPEGPSALEVTETIVTGGTTAHGVVRADISSDSFEAPLASSDSAIAVPVPFSVAFGPGVRSKTFTITTRPVLQQKTVTISTTSEFGVTRSDTLVIDAPRMTVSFNPSTVKGGRGTTGKVTLNGPAPAGLVLTFSSSKPQVAAKSGSRTVTMTEGATFVDFDVTTTAVAATTHLTITVSAGGRITEGILTVTPN